MSSGYGCARAIGVALIMSTALSGCVAGTLLGGALATTGVSVAQERSSRQALDDVEIRVTLNNKLLNEKTMNFSAMFPPRLWRAGCC